MTGNIITPSSSRPKAFDVTPPGQTPPSSSSRPVIITNQPEQADPMLTEQTQAEPDTSDFADDSATSPTKHHDPSATVRKELGALEKNRPTVESSLVTVSTDSVSKQSPFIKYLIIVCAVIVVLGLVYYYQ